MRYSVLISACLLLGGGAAAPAAAKQTADGRTTCDARYYDYMVGKSVDEARAINGSNYRMLSAGSARGEANPKRMTIVYDARSNLIVEVSCG